MHRDVNSLAAPPDEALQWMPIMLVPPEGLEGLQGFCNPLKWFMCYKKGHVLNVTYCVPSLEVLYWLFFPSATSWCLSACPFSPLPVNVCCIWRWRDFLQQLFLLPMSFPRDSYFMSARNILPEKPLLYPPKLFACISFSGATNCVLICSTGYSLSSHLKNNPHGCFMVSWGVLVLFDNSAWVYMDAFACW